MLPDRTTRQGLIRRARLNLHNGMRLRCANAVGPLGLRERLMPTDDRLELLARHPVASQALVKPANPGPAALYTTGVGLTPWIPV